MALTSQVKPTFAFSKGLITEASALVFPEDAIIEGENILFDRSGLVQRRFGIGYENSYTLNNTSIAVSPFKDHALSSYRWDNVNSDSTKSFGIIQIGSRIYFLDLFTDNPSDNIIPTVEGDYLTIAGAEVSSNPFQIAIINGLLIIANKGSGQQLVKYNSTTSQIEISSFDINIRDLFGQDDGLEVDERPSILSAEHEYNLLNQGWTSSTISTFNSDKGVYPSNADIVHLAKDSSDDFDSDLLVKQFFGTTNAPRGHNIIDAFSEADKGKITTVASYAGRVFYSGILDQSVSTDLPNYTGFIFFSQLINKEDTLSKCYSEADPTSEHISDIIDTDGGYVQIPEANNILKLISIGESLVVVAENGIWELFGGDAGFTATQYQLNKITSIGAASFSSIVDVEGTLFYWSKSGIYILTPDPASGRLISKSITETTIQTYYEGLSGVTKAYSVGTFDSISRKVSWLYNDEDTYLGVIDRNIYNKELIFDTILSAFYINEIKTISTDSPYVSGYLSTPNFNTSEYVENIYVGSDKVQVNGEDVIVTSQTRGRGVGATKYLTTRQDTSADTAYFTLSEYNNRDFIDWEEADSIGIDAAAYFISGYDISGDSMRKKQAPYATFHFNRTETGFEEVNGELEAVGASSCLVQARWDFANSANSGKFGTQFQAYRLPRNYIPSDVSDTFDYGQSIITTKNKLRGRGRALSLRFDTEAAKDLQLVGWSLLLSGGSAV